MRRVVLTFIGIVSLVFLQEVRASSGKVPGIGLEDIEQLLSLKSELENNQPALEKLNKVITHFEKRQELYKNEKDFIEYVYYFTHRKLLKQYSEYPSIEETLVLGDYDCLTATAIYSLIFKELDIDHTVVETNFHIYILINADTDEELLVESTDPRSGLLTDKREIEEAKIEYSSANLASSNSLIDFGFNIERRLKDKELIGLLYYNQSIRALNNGNWGRAQDVAQKALKFYPNERVTTLVEAIDSNYSSASL